MTRPGKYPALGLLVGLAIAGPSMATGYFGTVSGVIDGMMVVPCDGTAELNATIACVRAGTAGNFFQAVARAEPSGVMRAQAFVRGFGDQTTPTIGTATGAWTERMLFDPLPETVFMTFTIQMSGNQSTAFAGSGGIGASTAAFMQMGVYRGGQSLDPTVLDEVALVRSLDDYGTFQTHTLGKEVRVRGVSGGFGSTPVSPSDTVFPFELTVELDPGLERLDWIWRFAANAFVAAGADAFAFTDYSGTFRILDITARNAGGRNITHRLNIRFPSGQIYPLSLVPEPQAWAMLIAGFGLVGLACRRRAVDLDGALA
ncbi:PEPxxWA-CTERM sorting domain-containing protein [Thermaurantiacus sp.]